MNSTFATLATSSHHLSAAPYSFAIPLADSEEFLHQKAVRRQEMMVTLQLLKRIHAMRAEGNLEAAIRTVAAGYQHAKNLSTSSLRRKYYAYLNAQGDWRALVKGYVAPSKQPAEFVEFIKGLIEQNHRSVAAALDKLRDEIWPSGASVPGYGTWPEWYAANWPELPVPANFPRKWPQGWSPRNLRHYGPSRAERLMGTQGYAAAHGSLPVFRRDPSKLRPMEWIVIDDFQLDVRCYFRGDEATGQKPQVAYAGGLMAMDVGTRKKLAMLFGPMLDREVKQADGTTKTVRSYINQLSVQGLLYTVFKNNGLPEYDVTIICEHKSATVSPVVELMLMTEFGGRIRVHRTSLIDHKTLTNGFCEHGGTPWEKGWIESDFNSLWNMLADLKGYKGSNERLNAPADLAEQVAYTARFLGEGARALNLPAEIIDQLDLPFMSVEELELHLMRVIDRQERRTNHRMLGFATVTEFRWPNPALPAPAGIDPHEPNDFRSLALLTPAQQTLMVPQERKECVIERWERLSAQHPRQRVSPSVLALMLLSPVKCTLRNHAVSFAKDRTGYSYVDDANILRDVEEGTPLIAYVDFAAPECAVICRADGMRLGVLRMLGHSPAGVDVTDPEAVAEARARRATIVNRVLAGVRARPLHQERNAALAEARERNEHLAAAYLRETAVLPVGEQTALARGEIVAEQQRIDQRRRARAVPAQAAGKGLAELLPEQASAPEPAEAAATIEDLT